MKKYLYMALFCFVFSIAAKAQNYSLVDTFYYSFKDDIQMIEIVSMSDFLDSIKNNMSINNYKCISLYIDSKVNYNNVYIFRNKSGKILNIYGKNSQKVDVNKLRPVAENFFSQHFLLYQYSFSNYRDKNRELFAFRADNGKKGIINQKGEIVVEAIYDEFYRVKSNIIVANESIVIYLNEQENNIVNVGSRINYYAANYRRNYTDFIIFYDCVFSIYHKRKFIINNPNKIRFEEDIYHQSKYHMPYSIRKVENEAILMKSKVQAAAAEKDKK